MFYLVNTNAVIINHSDIIYSKPIKVITSSKEHNRKKCLMLKCKFLQDT